MNQLIGYQIKNEGVKMIIDFIRYPTCIRTIRYTDAGILIDKLTEQDAICLLAERNQLLKELAFYKDKNVVSDSSVLVDRL